MATPPSPPLTAPGARLTPRALVTGFALSLVLCAVNSYLTLSFGVIEEGPTIAALFFFALFVLSRTRVTRAEMVIVATMGSAGGSLGFISNFYAAQVMTGTEPPLWQMAAFAGVTSLVGLVFVPPLRELLILREELPWPGSRATASVISLLVDKGDRRQPFILLAAGVGAVAFVVLNSDGGFGVVPDASALPLFGLSAHGAAIAWSPFAIGGSYLMGWRTCLGFLVGACALLLMAPALPTPESPERYIWPGLGFLVASGLAGMAVNWRVISAALRSLRSLGGRTGDDDPVLRPRTYLAFAMVTLIVTAAFARLVLHLDLLVVLALVIFGGLVQNVIATRAQAQTAFNPARVMGVLLEGVVALAGGSSATVNLAGAGTVAGSGAQAGNLSGDLAYGRWLRVPSRWQFWAQTATLAPCAVTSALVFDWIRSTKTLALEGGDLPAPVAKMWAASALVFAGSSPLPAGALGAMAAAAAIGVVCVLIEAHPKLGRFMPSTVGIGIALVLPVAYDLAFFVGGVLTFLLLRRWLGLRDITLTTVAVACIVGEGIGGVLKPVLGLMGAIGG